MAGIAGTQGADDGQLDNMLERIKHRGQHETWIQQVGEVNLGCCELNAGGESKAG